ncbi:hypothetical protein G647_04038 [Cladophialophora carrionii CBS 160.54]|uniref:Rhodopsin domain-containing protein n=1 Tax=Cladophialophora carrionii CBS 160.54 TaxID=1279043 RepID=V9DCP1_9EURO|nr:uncharacterized protein G647_04038 [Cladophialophora carrionii CBS 160.54]ETI24669.1 hypothetical protein G647_04038 [Cladophialophora carrionii CBS 160.54]
MSNSGVFGPTPPGVDLSETHNAAVVEAVVSLMVIGTVAVVLRFVSQFLRDGRKFLSWDDYLIIPALVLAHGTAICSLVSLPYGGGKHLWVLSAQDFTTIWQILFAYVMIYAGAVSFTKASIVMFYWRLFHQKWTTYVCLFLVWSYFVVIIVTINTGCQPLEYFWTQYTTPGAEGHCINVSLFFFANGIWAMLVDVCILITPIRPIYKLHMSRNMKIMIAGVLGLGAFVCIASIVRIITIHHLINSGDLTWAMSSVFIWSCCEPFIGIVCACIPCYAPLFRRIWKQAHTSSRSKGTSAVSGGKVSGQDSKASQNASKGQRSWNRIQSDDEVQLTNFADGPGSMRTKGSDEASGLKDMHVKTWEAHAV